MITNTTFSSQVTKPKFGYKLYDLGDKWQIVGPTANFSGSFEQVKTFAVLNLGFEAKEIDIGKREMDKHFHNGAEYGLFKKFMWSFDTVPNTALN
jgi:hypothetical protein